MPDERSAYRIARDVAAPQRRAGTRAGTPSAKRRRRTVRARRLHASLARRDGDAAWQLDAERRPAAARRADPVVLQYRGVADDRPIARAAAHPDDAAVRRAGHRVRDPSGAAGP